MANLRQTIEHCFELTGRSAYRHRLKTILLVLLITLPMIIQLPKITLDTTNESFFREDDRALLDYNEFRDQFGKDELFIVAVSSSRIFTPEYLKKIKALHEELAAKLPYLNEITSLVNARNTLGEEDRLVVEDLMGTIPESADEMARFKERVLNNPFYLNNLVSADGKFTTIVVKALTYVPNQEGSVLAGFEDMDISAGSKPGKEKRYLSNTQSSEILDVMRPILEKHNSPDFSIHLAGLPVVVDGLDRLIRKDMETLVPLSLLVIVLFLFIMFRSISGVIYPLLTVILSLLATMGLMAALGIPITNITQILPTFMIVVGVSDSVHILAIFYRKYADTGDKEESIVHALGHSGLAIAMTSITTAVGLASFATATVAPIADLGIVAPIGVLLAMLYTILLLPALISLFPVRRPKKKKAHVATPMDRLLAKIALISCTHSRGILFITFAIIVVATAGITQLNFSHNGLKWLPETSDIRQDTVLLDKKLAGTITLEVVIDTGEKNGLYDPAFLHRLEDSVRFVEELRGDDIYVGKAFTLTTILKEIHQALNENRPEFYAVPDNRNVIAQEFLLFENSGSDDLEEIVDTEFRKVRFTIKAPFRDAVQYKQLIADINGYFTENYPNSEIKLTGVMAIFAEMIDNVISTMTRSYVIALTLITFLMMFLIGRVRIGVLSMLPNLVPILVVLGVMGWLRIPMDMATILVGSITISLVVDDTIHFMHNFRRYFEQSGDPEQAVNQTLHTVGRAMLVTSIVLSFGFFINMLSAIKSTYNFGLLTGITVILALLSDYFLGPALMVLAYKCKQTHNASGSNHGDLEESCNSFKTKAREEISTEA